MMMMMMMMRAIPGGTVFRGIFSRTCLQRGVCLLYNYIFILYYVCVYGWVHVCVLFCIGMPMGGGRPAAGLAIIHVRMYICIYIII